MLENLLSGQEEFQKEIGVTLDKDIQTWPTAIIQAAMHAVPFISNFKNVDVQFNKVDKEKGYAIGAIVVASDKSKISMPFIVKNFIMSPIDVFIDSKGNFRPGTQERVQKALFNPEVMDETVDPNKENPFGFNYSSIMRDTYPPSGGGYALGRESIASQLFNSILASVTPDDKEKVAKYLMRNPEVILMAKHAGIEDKVNKILAATPMTKKASSDLSASIYDIFQVIEGQIKNSVIVKMASSIYGKPVTKEMTRGTFKKFAEEMAAQGQPGAEMAGQNPGQTVAPQEIAGDPNAPDNYIDIEAAMNMTPADRPGVYKVMTQLGEKIIGYVFPNVFTFDMQPAQVKVFAGMGQSAIQQEIIGELVDGMGTPKLSKIEAGKAYVIAHFGDKAGQALCFVPVQVASVMAIGSEVCYLVQDMMQGVPVLIVPTKGLETVVPATPEMLGDKIVAMQGAQAAFLVPDDITAIEFTGTTQLLQSPMEAQQIMQMGGPKAVAAQQQAQQQAQAQQGAEQPTPTPQDQAQPQAQPEAPGQPKQASIRSGRVIYDHYSKQYDIQCPDIEKIAGLQTECLSADDLVFSLTVGGVNPNEAVLISKYAKAKSQCPLYDVNPPVAVFENRQDLVKKAYAELSKKLPVFDGMFLKVATMVDYDEDVDTVLSLGFLKPENLTMFTKAIPHLSKTESTLAALLMASRLGKRELSEDDVKECMVRLTKIIDTIKEVM